MQTYDLQELCPKLDRYWMYDYLKRISEMKKNNNTLDIFVDNSPSRKRGDNEDAYDKIIADPYAYKKEIREKQIQQIKGSA
mmetsp:Transcript_35380/g.34414  ORF Transcript_35380/g.34414 Transcript_35380/m.34414 type:complete len:81 (+) Transcript_35380:913-1155(+)|eukprot:CAMPEP_0170550298 /NCGR_PEP_ID=MMETSP0211-20121228/8366_1 /TAXON_ID=311385 /ORGANISM="Pseudokeronopsis sp., Strain OXSARD2" /LENGTH=80 /DNA_ID=CAMNT_0010856773 /DNA_START=1339 /DNA_END=1581 /DNA_ORIENTATION=+